MISYKNIKQIVAVLCLVSLVGCSSGGDDDGGGTAPPVVENPEAAKLISPIKDAECNQGNIISDTESKVTFEWNASKNTDEYTLVIKNLLDKSTRNIKVTATKKEENLLRGVPYSWHVVSKSKSVSKTATSETWKLYNAGVGVENYAPFPAELVSPTMGGLTKQTVSLSWNGSDIDNDIESYDVYLGTNNPPTTLHTNTTTTAVNDIALSADTVYYWKVITKDSEGNNSESPIFEFRTEK